MTTSFRSTRDVIIRCENPDDATRFYENVLGLAVTLRRDGLVGFETGAFQLFVEKGSPPHGPVFDLRVPDLVAAKAKLLASGCTLIEENDSIPRCYLSDPFGLTFNLEQT